LDDLRHVVPPVNPTSVAPSNVARFIPLNPAACKCPYLPMTKTIGWRDNPKIPMRCGSPTALCLISGPHQDQPATPGPPPPPPPPPPQRTSRRRGRNSEGASCSNLTKNLPRETGPEREPPPGVPPLWIPAVRPGNCRKTKCTPVRDQDFMSGLLAGRDTQGRLRRR